MDKIVKSIGKGLSDGISRRAAIEAKLAAAMNKYMGGGIFGKEISSKSEHQSKQQPAQSSRWERNGSLNENGTNGVTLSGSASVYVSYYDDASSTGTVGSTTLTSLKARQSEPIQLIWQVQ